MTMKNKIYIIDGKTYLSHINDEVHLYGLLHQLAFLAARIRDCSGFVSYVLTNTGLCNTGRLGAQGLYNISTPVSDPQPGDLVFFVGTYDTSGISHVGIYVGDNMMLHCGDPISYTNLNTSYWQSHFYAYGRPPYN